MITIDLGKTELYDALTNQFDYVEGGVIRFEYSLKAVYDWESKWKKPFLKGGLTEQEMVDFYKMMALDPFDEKLLTIDVIRTLSEYIQNSGTATTFSSNQETKNENKFSTRPKIYTAEELYALMFSAGVPIEFENRNLNRLLIILKIIGSYNEPPKKMSRSDILRQNASLNAQRKAQLKTRG